MKKVTLYLLLFSFSIIKVNAQKQQGNLKSEFIKVLSNPTKYPVLQVMEALEEKEKYMHDTRGDAGIERKADDKVEFEEEDHLLYKSIRFYIDRMDTNGYMAPWNIISGDELLEYKNGNAALKTGAPLVANWKPYGPTLARTTRGIGRIDAIVVDKNNDDIMYAGSPAGGLWKTINKGQSWSCLTNSIPKAIGVSCIAIDYTTSPNTIFIATGDRDSYAPYIAFGGIFKSSDGGNSWEELGNLTNSGERAIHLIVHPVNNNNLFLLTTYNCYRSIDGGLSWTAIGVDPDKQQFYSMAYNPSQPDLITLLAKINFNNKQQLNVFTSNNFGANNSFVKSIGTPHHEVTDGYRITNAKLAIHPHAPNIYYVVYNRETGNQDVEPVFGKLKVSYNNGTTWEEKYSSTYNQATNKVSNNLFGGDSFFDLRSQSDYNFTFIIDSAIQANPADTCIYFGGINMVRSTNGGSDFKAISDWTDNKPEKYTHADQHCTVFNSANELIMGNDGGVFIRKDKSDAGIFELISQGLMVSQVYNTSVDEADELKIWVALQDNGVGNLETIQLNGEKNIFYNNRFSGDGLEVAKANGRVYSMSQNGKFSSGTAIGNNFTPSNPGEILYPYCYNYDVAVWNSAISINPEVPEKLVAGNSSLYYSEDAGANWKCAFNALSNNFTGKTLVRKIAPSLTNPKKIYAVMQIKGDQGYSPKSLKSRLLVSTDGGKTFAVASGPNPPAITSIAVGRNNGKEVVYGVCANYNAGQKVFMRKNNKDPWTNLTANLPNVPINCIVYDTTSITDDVYVGTDAGVYYMSDNSSWVLFDTGMPVCLVSDLDIDYQNKKLIASTFGRGLWQCDLLSSQSVEIISEAGPIICQNENIVLEVAGAPAIAYLWSAGSTTTLQSINNPGVYTVTVTYADASTKSASIRISLSSAAFHSYWEKTFGSANVDDEGVAISCDGNNAYFVGNTYPGLTSDLLLGALNDKGKTLWQKTMGGPSEDEAGGICLFEPGELIIGAISATSGSDVPGPNPSSPGFNMTWAFKINSSNGNFIKRANGSPFNFTYNHSKSNNKLKAVVKGPDNEVYFGGSFNNLNYQNNLDYHIYKINGLNGSFTSVGTHGAKFNDFLNDITYSSFNNKKSIYATGQANYDPNEANSTFGKTFYSVKFGKVIFFQTFLAIPPPGTFSNRAGWSIGLSLPGNSVNANGIFIGESESSGACISATLDGKFCNAGHTLAQAFHMVTLPKFGGFDLYIRKQNANGSRHDWVMSGGGSGDDFASDLLTSTENSFILSGTTNSNDNDFDGFNGFGNGDIFLMKFTDNGVKAGAILLGGNEVDEGNSLAWNADSTFFYVCGTTTKNNQKDVFIAKVTANTCPMPYKNLDSDPTLTTAKLSWENRDCTNAYEVWYRLYETSVFSKLTVNGKSVTVTGLQSGSEYEWKVRSNCGNGNYSQFSSIQYFRTKSAKEGVALSSQVDFEASLYPNPNSGNFSINLNAVQDGIASITILDGTGRIVGEKTMNVIEGNNLFDYNDSGLAQGIYFVRVTIGQQAKLIRVAVY